MLPRIQRAALLLALAAPCACGGDASAAGAPSGSAGGASGCGAGGCDAAGVQDDGCLAGEVGIDGGECRPAGAAEMCAAGFAPADDGCAPILPDAPCATGLLALLGETQCHAVAPCGTAPWGDAPRGAGTQHVDAAYQAGASDGTAQSPWTTVQSAIDAAASGAVIAIAAGSYVEALTIGQPVVLWGRCPELVEIVGTGASIAAIQIGPSSGGSEIHTIAVRGPSVGMYVSGADVAVDRVWVHDTASIGLAVEDSQGAATLTLEGSLFEATADVAVFVGGTEVTIEDSVLRETAPAADGSFGHGVAAQRNPATGARATVRMSASVVESSHDLGVYVSDSDATIEASLVRDTLPAADGQFGVGMQIGGKGDVDASRLTLRSSVVERSRTAGVDIQGSEAEIVGSTVRDTLPSAADQSAGMGVIAEVAEGRRSTLTMRSSVVERSRSLGVFVMGSDAVLEGIVVRDTDAEAGNQTFGRGIQIQHQPDTKSPSTAGIRSSLVRDNVGMGILVVGSSAEIVGTRVVGSDPGAVLGAFGDGIVAMTYDGVPASAVVRSSWVADNARSGIASFGAAVGVGSTLVECNPISLDGEPYQGVAPDFTDEGANACECGGTQTPCTVLSTQLVPPDGAPP